MLKRLFARFAVMDSFGTYQLCYTAKQAQDWLDYCGGDAYIVDRLIGCEIGCNYFPA